MPKKSGKKSKNPDLTILKADVKEEKPRSTSKSSHSKDSISCVCGESSRDSSEQRKSLVEALVASPILTETSQKSQMKRQKRKNKKHKKDSDRQWHVEEVCQLPETVWEFVGIIKKLEECTAKINEDAIEITEVEVVDDLERELFNSSPSMNDEEENLLREFLKTLEILDGQQESSTKRKRSFSDGNEYEPIEYSNNNKTVVETIPEEIFEEFLENEEMKKTKETIKSRGVSKNSPKSSPKSKRKTQTSSLKVPPKTFVATSPKMLYSYNGVPFDEPSRKPLAAFEDFDDGIIVINTIRSFPRERHPNKRLDVIVEENSDFSDASEIKTEPDMVVKTLIDRRGKIFDDGVKNFDFQMQPVIKETVKIFPLDQKIKESVIVEESEPSNCYSVEPVITETLKMSEDVVKIELPESETENEVEIKREEIQNKSQVEIVYLDDDEEFPGDESSENTGIVDVPISSFISDADIKYIEDESESLGSSGNREEGEDGTEADVESELDSRRATCIMEELDDDFNFENPYLPQIKIPSEIKLEPLLQNHKPEDPYEEMMETVLSEEKIETKNSEIVTEVENRTKKSIQSDPLEKLFSKAEEKLEDQKVAGNEQFKLLTNKFDEQCGENGNIAESNVPNENEKIEVLPNESEEKPRMSTDEILCAVQLNLEKFKNSPSYSRQESTSSCASNSFNTAKYLPPYSRSVSEPDSTFKTVSGGSLEEKTNDQTVLETVSIIISPLNEEDRTLSEAESLVPDDVSDHTSDFEMKMRNNNSKSEIAELKKRGSVKNIVGTMEKNINEILMSKLKVIECFEEPIMSEATWLKVLEMTKREMQTGEAEKLRLIEEDVESVEPVGISENEEPMKRNPDSLSDLAERKMLSLPYGWLVLKKIGLCRCCSGKNQQVDDEIKTKPKEEKKKAKRISYAERRSLSDSDTAAEMKLYNLQCWSSGSPRSVSKTPELWRPPTPPPSPYVEFTNATDKWYGMHVPDSDILLGLSASQKKEFEKRSRKKMSNEMEAAFLLDLHQKFLERRCYFEPNLPGKDRRVDFELKNAEWNFSDTELTKGKNETFDFSKIGETYAMKTEGARKFEIEKKSRLVGNGCFLAISQNATSDDFVPELNINSSVGSSCESHEVSLVQNQAAMFDIWQKQRKFGSTSKNSEEVCGENNDFSGKQHHFPNKPNKQDDDLLVIEERDKPGQKRISSGFRPEMTGSEDDKNVYTNHDKFLKEYRNSKKIVQEKENNHQENQVVTEKLPTVADIIKNFESTDKETEQNYENSLKSITENYHISKKGDIALIQNGENGYDRRRIQDLVQKERRKSVPGSNLSEGELFKQKMYEEYMSKLAERVERRQHKAIKMSQTNEIESPEEPKFLDIENEFICRVKERNDKMKLTDNENPNIMFESFEKKCQEFTSFWEGQYSDLESLRKRQVRRSSGAKDESDKETMDNTPETTSSKRSSIQLILDTTSDVAGLPKHLQEFLRIEEDDLSDVKIGSTMLTPTFKATAPRPGVWSPAQPPPEEKPEEKEENEERKKLEDEPIPPIWTPKSAQASPVAERKEFRPVNFESPTLPRKKYIQEEKSTVIPPWQHPGGDKTPESVKTPGSPGLNLPRVPNPTVTLLQKAREGHLPRGAHYLNNNMTDSYSDSEHRIHRDEVFYSSKDDSERPRKIEIIPKLPVHGIGPTTKEGIPVVLRSEVTEENKEKWYKRMYESLHKAGKDEDYVTVKYRTSPSRKVGGFGYQAGSSSGYQSEPENLVYDSNRQVNKYQTLDRRRSERDKENDCISVTLPRSRASTPRYETYKNQPDRIENYEPGHSSISKLEAKQWWDEVLEIFDRQEERSVPVHKTESPKSFMTYALKDAGYLSDPQHVIKRREENFQSSLSPQEQKEAYRIIQKGGEVPLRGLRKPAPERPKEPVDFDFLNEDQIFRDLTPDSARKYVESEVTIHYKSPVRAEAKAYLSEEELARRQAESMKRIYQEERRRKYLQELQDMNSRRHTDNFIPSQKSPISLHRYDDFPFDHSSSYSPTRFRDSSSEPVLVARGLYDFAGRRPRELAFRRGDIIFIIRRLDKNWCEGELNGAVGLFPLSYVEIIPYNDVNPKYGRARAKYDFIPQTTLELLARKGDMITLIRRIDDNWFEGRIGERTGIIPNSYCHVLVWPRSISNRLPVRQEKSKPVASPAAHSLIHNGKVPTKHSYIPWYSGPNSPGPSTTSSAASGIVNLSDGHTNLNHRYGDVHVNFADEDFATNRPNNKTSAMQPLNISINPRSEPALYQVLFNHIPNNDDELELIQGETVLVVEKCEDGWYVGSNPMTGKIGIFPGNHVRRMSPEFV